MSSPASSLSLRGKVAIVTGASPLELATRGAKVSCFLSGYSDRKSHEMICEKTAIYLKSRFVWKKHLGSFSRTTLPASDVRAEELVVRINALDNGSRAIKTCGESNRPEQIVNATRAAFGEQVDNSISWSTTPPSGSANPSPRSTRWRTSPPSSTSTSRGVFLMTRAVVPRPRAPRANHQ